jgi:ABC-type cobalamin/Fe3+-siderophores transport system ATPase subunit
MSDAGRLHQLQSRSLSVGYSAGAPILAGLELSILPGKITALIGANGSGKSTLLRTLGHAIAPLGGTVLLDGADIAVTSRKSVSRILSLLPQSPVSPEGLTVRELCEFGRHPHRGFLRRPSDDDREAVERALSAARLGAIAEQRVDTLSGGQRQRAWIAMALAQETPIMLLDEPTTYLDIAHQVEVLELLRELNQDAGTTVVMVLHDLNQAAHYAHHVVAVADGGIHASGPPEEVFTPELIRAVFGVAAVVVPHPVTGSPLCLPLAEREVSAREGLGSGGARLGRGSARSRR